MWLRKIQTDVLEQSMNTSLLPAFIRENYEVHEWKHACAILHSDFPDEWKDIVEVLTNFRFKKKLDKRWRGPKVQSVRSN